MADFENDDHEEEVGEKRDAPDEIVNIEEAETDKQAQAAAAAERKRRRLLIAANRAQKLTPAVSAVKPGGNFYCLFINAIHSKKATENAQNWCQVYGIIFKDVADENSPGFAIANRLTDVEKAMPNAPSKSGLRNAIVATKKQIIAVSTFKKQAENNGVTITPGAVVLLSGVFYECAHYVPRKNESGAVNSEDVGTLLPGEPYIDIRAATIIPQYFPSSEELKWILKDCKLAPVETLLYGKKQAYPPERPWHTVSIEMKIEGVKTKVERTVMEHWDLDTELLIENAPWSPHVVVYLANSGWAYIEDEVLPDKYYEYCAPVVGITPPDDDCLKGENKKKEKVMTLAGTEKSEKSFQMLPLDPKSPDFDIFTIIYEKELEKFGLHSLDIWKACGRTIVNGIHCLLSIQANLTKSAYTNDSSGGFRIKGMSQFVKIFYKTTFDTIGLRLPIDFVEEQLLKQSYNNDKFNKKEEKQKKDEKGNAVELVINKHMPSNEKNPAADKLLKLSDPSQLDLVPCICLNDIRCCFDLVFKKEDNWIYYVVPSTSLLQDTGDIKEYLKINSYYDLNQRPEELNVEHYKTVLEWNHKNIRPQLYFFAIRPDA